MTVGRNEKRTVRGRRTRMRMMTLMMTRGMMKIARVRRNMVRTLINTDEGGQGGRRRGETRVRVGEEEG